jgi:hypothetical protein
MEAMASPTGVFALGPPSLRAMASSTRFVDAKFGGRDDGRAFTFSALFLCSSQNKLAHGRNYCTLK